MSSLTYSGYGGRGRASGAPWQGWDRFDYVMVLAALALVGYGLLLIYSGSLPWYEGPVASFGNPVAKQVIFAGAGLAAMLAVSKIDYHHFTHYAWVF